MQTAGWQFVPAELDETISGKGLNALLGHCYHAHGDGWIEMFMPWQESVVGDRGGGALAHGPVMALLDNCAGVSIWIRRGGYLPQVTLDLRTDYLRPLKAGAGLVCRCECVSLSATTAFARGFAYEDDPQDPALLVSAAYALL